MNEQLAEELSVERDLLEQLVVMMAKAYEASGNHPNPVRSADLMKTGVLTVLKVYEASRWQPIETGPKNGNEVLVLLTDGLVKIARYNDDRYRKKPRPFWCWSPSRISMSRADQPTHWRPLPLSLATDP